MENEIFVLAYEGRIRDDQPVAIAVLVAYMCSLSEITGAGGKMP